jgi:hypothetical protein
MNGANKDVPIIAQPAVLGEAVTPHLVIGTGRLMNALVLDARDSRPPVAENKPQPCTPSGVLIPAREIRVAMMSGIFNGVFSRHPAWPDNRPAPPYRRSIRGGCLPLQPASREARCAAKSGLVSRTSPGTFPGSRIGKMRRPQREE